MLFRTVSVMLLLVPALVLLPTTQGQVGCPNPPRDCQALGSLRYMILDFQMDGVAASGTPGFHMFHITLNVSNVHETKEIETTFSVSNSTFIFTGNGASETVLLGPGGARDLTVSFDVFLPSSLTVIADWTLNDVTEGLSVLDSSSLPVVVVTQEGTLGSASAPPSERAPSIADRATFGLGGLAVGGIAVHLVHRRRGG